MATESSPRNPGIPLDIGWIERCVVDMPATNRRAATHKTRRSIKKEWQAAWLLRAVTCIDLTTLDGDDTPSKVVKVARNCREDVVLIMGVARQYSFTPLHLLIGRSFMP